jgi:adenosine deaminase
MEDFMELTREKILTMPKAELHCHLDGSIRLATMIELAASQNVELPSSDEAELSRILGLGKNYESLVDYLTVFKHTLSVLQDTTSLERVAFELAEDCAQENVRWLEVRYSPILHTDKGLSLPAVMDAVLDGLRRAERMYNIRCGVIVCGIRNINPTTSLKLAELTVAYKNNGVVGFDLAGAEANFPAKDHREAFYLIRNNNINCTVHAGEAYGPESIHQALHYLSAHRIGHSTRLKEDGDLLNYMNDRRVPIEACPTSNVQTRVVGELEDHPLKFYLDYGLRVTINTDNRLIGDTTITDELWHMVKTFDLTEKEVVKLITNGFKSAFLSYREKRTLIHSVLEELGYAGVLVGY